MDFSLIINALQLAAHLLLPVLAVVIAGALIAGVVKVATQIEDPSLGFAGRLFAAAVFLYLSAEYGASQISQFADRVWGGAEFYF